MKYEMIKSAVYAETFSVSLDSWMVKNVPVHVYVIKLENEENVFSGEMNVKLRGFDWKINKLSRE